MAIGVFRTLVGDGIDTLTDVGALFDHGGDDRIIAIALMSVAAFAILLAWALYAATRYAIRHLSTGPGTVFATAAILLAGADAALGGTYPGDAALSICQAVFIVVGCILFVALGGAALLAWAARLSLRNLFAVGHMATIALPVILMLVLFSFFAAEIWQMGTLLNRNSLLLLSLVVATLTTLIVLRVSAIELRAGATALTADERNALLRGTPAEDRGSDVDTGAAGLHAAQRINMLLAIALAQLIQAAIFVFLIAGLLIVIGAITVPSDLVQTWIGGGENPPKLHVEPVVIQGLPLPLTLNLLKSAALLAVVSALPFVFSTVSETRYREAFFEPIVADMRRAILVRAALRDTQQSGPPASC